MKQQNKDKLFLRQSENWKIARVSTQNMLMPEEMKKHIDKLREEY